MFSVVVSALIVRFFFNFNVNDFFKLNTYNVVKSKHYSNKASNIVKKGHLTFKISFGNSIKKSEYWAFFILANF